MFSVIELAPFYPVTVYLPLSISVEAVKRHITLTVNFYHLSSKDLIRYLAVPGSVTVTEGIIVVFSLSP